MPGAAPQDWSFVPAVWGIASAAIIYALRLIQNAWIDHTKRKLKEKTIIESLIIEINIIRRNSTEYARQLNKQLDDGSLETSITEDDKYYPYLPASERKTMVFENFKNEIYFLPNDVLDNILQLYLEDALLFDCVKDFGSDSFISLNAERKLGAIANTLPLARRLNKAADLAQTGLEDALKQGAR